ncbi:MAG TPA: non-heme iron oxygenase ferredoxin subunit [Stellaceae bacterium]|nr:non-heme iron oxygenase ferredoxin subunit [Stellaceae bacterium]
MRASHWTHRPALPMPRRMSGTLVRLCAAAEVSEDSPRQVEREGFTYAVFKSGDEYFVTADECTHGPGFLSEGAVIGGEIECPFHQGRFDLRTGACTAPPCYEPVRVWTAHLVDGDICIDPDEAR